MPVWAQLLIAIVGSILASSGLWALILNFANKRDAKTRMLVGLGHDRVMFLAMHYIERGYITKDEYENLHDYLYKPYHDLGGNGSADRVMAEVDRLPIVNEKRVDSPEQMSFIP